MKHTQTEMEAIAMTLPSVRPVLNPVTLEEDLHLSYDAEIQYKRKPPATRLILCSSLDDVHISLLKIVNVHKYLNITQHCLL